MKQFIDKAENAEAIGTAAPARTEARLRSTVTPANAVSPIVFYYYYDMTDTEAFCRILEARFRALGYTRPIEFRRWDCYEDAPAGDGDIYCYDAMVLTTLADEGYIRPLPDTPALFDTSRIFPWIPERGLIRDTQYGLPFMACACVLICRKEDDFPIRNVFDLPAGTAAPLKSLAINYYLYALCNIQNRRDAIMKTLRQIRRCIGDEAYRKSALNEFDGADRFKRGECRYLMGFTEDLRFLDPGAYVVRLANYSDLPVNEMPLIQMDLASLGSSVSDDKLADCIELLRILADSDFICDICTSGGRLQYMLPADMSVYPRLAQQDPVYRDFYRIMDNADNGVLRYGRHFYEEYRPKKAELHRLLEKL